MFIQTEATPNPATLKFLPGGAVLENGSREIQNAEEARVSPLASALFAIDGVSGVFFGADFISVTKSQRAKIFGNLLWPVIIKCCSGPFNFIRSIISRSSSSPTSRADTISSSMTKS